MRTWILFPLSASLGILLACAGCDAVLGLSQFTFDGSAADATDECVGPNGCWACTPTTNDQFLNSCSSQPCVAFDETRLTPLLSADGGLPPLPPIQDAAADTGVKDASDAAPIDAGGD